MNKIVCCCFKRVCVFMGGIKDQYDVDLMDVGFYLKDNDGVKYLLVVIDVFMCNVWVNVLKN